MFSSSSLVRPLPLRIHRWILSYSKDQIQMNPLAWSFHNGFNSVLPNKSRYWPFEFVFPDLLFQVVKDSCGQAFPSTGMKGWGVVEVKVFISPSRLLTVISTQPQSASLKQTSPSRSQLWWVHHSGILLYEVRERTGKYLLLFENPSKILQKWNC